MDQQLKECLENKELNYILPFLWLHGESHEELKEEILAIKNSGCLSFCAESRPYPAFCGEQWWEDFGFILKTAQELGMQVWLLDDKQFPTGYANGLIERKYPEKRRLHIAERHLDVIGPRKIDWMLLPFETEDRLISVCAVRRTGRDESLSDEVIPLKADASGRYNKAFERYRSEFLKANLTWILVAVVALFVVWQVAKRLLKKRRDAKLAAAAAVPVPKTPEEE